MTFWDDTLKICPKCKSKVSLNKEEKTRCPKCGTTVWFLNYRKLPIPDPLPESPADDLWKNPVTTLLLIAVAIFGFAAIVAFWKASVVGVVCTLGSVGFAVFGFLRHAEARVTEQKLKHLTQINNLATVLHERNTDLTRRYLSLLATGDTRIEHYYTTIYLKAKQEREAADAIRAQALQDRQAVASVEQRIYLMAERLLNDQQKWVASKLRADPESYQRHRTTLMKMFDFVESVGYPLPAQIRTNTLAELQKAYQLKVREQALKDEQRRLNQQAREEARLLREQEQAIREAEQREAELAERLAEALANQADVHSAELEELQRQLAEAQAQSERAKSLAQLTKVGHVYILSNIGSFGEDVFKVGMTRREDPHHRVKELGDASVPFPFDVHAMISCENAPALENALHKELTRHRVNRVNLRKEYFKVPLEVILNAVKRHHGVIEYVAEAEALEYRETQNISPEELVKLTEELAEMGVNLNEDDDIDLD